MNTIKANYIFVTPLFNEILNQKIEELNKKFLMSFILNYIFRI